MTKGWKSEAQRRHFIVALDKGKIDKKTFDAIEAATDRKKLLPTNRKPKKLTRVKIIR